MLYPEFLELERKIGFDKIREMVFEACISDTGRKGVKRMVFQVERGRVEQQLNQVQEFLSILQLQENFPSLEYIDAGQNLVDLKKEGQWVDQKPLYDIGKALETFLEMKNFLRAKKERYPNLEKLSESLFFDESLPTGIVSKFNEHGELLDSASPQLKAIRKEIAKVSGELRNYLTRIFKSAKDSGFIPENSSPAVRDGRMVIPVLAEHKRKVKGFVHDSSNTGHAVFIEPAEVLDSNNKRKELEYEERREINRILEELSAQIRDQYEEINRSFYFAGIFDFIRAKAKVSNSLNSVKPKLVNGKQFRLIEALHPILFINHSESGKEVVPLDIQFDPDSKILLISGPNAGGKSVCLKTVGILQYMLQCGLLVPVHGDSSMAFFESIMVDIGDEQSIDDDLSTYSSHLKNMDVIINKANHESLVLIDEFGTGTDPQYGGAIAEAILEELVKNGVTGVITTHYNNLKNFAEHHSGISNASMLYDVEKLKPLYKLQIGKPGSSYALEVAGNIGLNNKVIEKARNLVGADQIKVDQLLAQLENEKLRYENLVAEAAKNKEKLEHTLSKYETLKEEIEQKKGVIITKAKEEASQILKQTNKEIEKTIRHIKENKAQKVETKKVRKSLEEFKETVKKKPVKKKITPSNELKFVDGPISVGDQVFISGKDVSGEVVLIKGKDARISVGELQIMAKLKDLKKLATQPKPAVKTTRSRKTIDIANKNLSYSTSIDVRGKRAEEVVVLLDKWLDDALLLGHNQLKILHGRGDGILRNVIREELKKYKEVSKVESEHIDRGGDGITLVTLK